MSMEKYFLLGPIPNPSSGPSNNTYNLLSLFIVYNKLNNEISRFSIGGRASGGGGYPWQENF